MPNRKITQFPAITATDINDADLLTTVSVFEVDPALRNKKISFTDFRAYLDQYYINSLNFDPLIVTNLIVQQGVSVSGQTILGSTLVVSGVGTFLDNVNISGNTALAGGLSVAGTISGITMDIGVITTDQIEVQGTGTFITATGGACNFITGNFQELFTTTLTGQNANFVSGTFGTLHADQADFDSLVISGITITGELVSSGTINANNINATGTISGATITGNLVNVATLNAQSGIFEYLSGETITGNTISGTTGTFTNLSGTTITGDTINAGVINVGILNAGTLSFSGDQVVSGDFRALGDLSTPSGVYANEVIGSGSVSGALISGISGVFQSEVSAPLISGTSGLFDTIVVSGAITTSGNLNVEGNANISGNLVVTGQTTLESGLSVTGDVYFSSGLVVSGNTTVTGNVTIHSGLTVSGTISGEEGNFTSGTYSGLQVTGNLRVPYGDLINPGLSFASGNTVVDGILIDASNPGDNHVMTFVNQNSSGMSLTSGNGRFILTIWGD